MGNLGLVATATAAANRPTVRPPLPTATPHHHDSSSDGNDPNDPTDTMAKVLGKKPVKNLWDEICAEFESASAPFVVGSGGDQESVATELSQYDASKHSPVFYGHMVAKIPVDTSVIDDFKPEHSHPAFLGHAVVHKFIRPLSPPTSSTIPLPDPKTCSPIEYLEHYIFPVLLPGMFELLKAAKAEKCFERKWTKFNACDFLTEWLFNRNPKRSDEEFTQFFEIPFVKSWLVIYPRAPIALSLLLSDEEAAIIIQSFWRGYQVRCMPEVHELREWQKELREEKEGYSKKISEFWTKQACKVGVDMETDTPEEFTGVFLGNLEERMESEKEMKADDKLSLKLDF
ncbi:IQ domain-containing protein K isoform X2 [Callorhinchus milii]|nr:IQ domain-containing protein K isoform X2 [Callorhinchus milii]